MAEPGRLPREPPVLLTPMATSCSRKGRAPALTPRRCARSSIRSACASTRARDIGRYLTGLLVFLGLLGTFWGLLETVSSVGNVIGDHEVRVRTPR